MLKTSDIYEDLNIKNAKTVHDSQTIIILFFHLL